MKTLCLSCILMNMAHILSAQTPDSLPEPPRRLFDFEATYTGDFAGNAMGGIKQGFGFLGYATMNITFNTEAAGWWKGGSLTVGGASTHGATPTDSWLGDFQVADNIEAGNHIFLQNIYFQQNIGPVDITAGLHDFNAAYAFLDHASLFLNSSFGINSVLASSFDVPMFPINSWGLTVNWNATPWLNIRAGAYDSPLGFDENPYNIKWRFTPDKGAVIAGEIEFLTNIRQEMAGTYKIGTVYQTAKRLIEVHFCGEQILWKRQERNLALFLTAAWTPKAKSENFVHWSAGMHFTGIFSKKGKDCLGFACTSSWLNNDFGQETALEFNYQYTFNEHFYLQPDIQYIITPAGTEETYKNPLFMALRLGISF